MHVPTRLSLDLEVLQLLGEVPPGARARVGGSHAARELRAESAMRAFWPLQLTAAPESRKKSELQRAASKKQKPKPRWPRWLFSA